MQPESVEGDSSQQEHFLSQPLNHCRRRSIACRGHPEQHWCQFMEPTSRQLTEVQRRSYLHDGCRAEVLHDRLAQRGGLPTTVLGPHCKEKRLSPERLTAAPVARDDTHRWKPNYPACSGDAHTVDARTTNHRDPVGCTRAGSEQCEGVIVQGYFCCPAGA